MFRFALAALALLISACDRRTEDPPTAGAGPEAKTPEAGAAPTVEVPALDEFGPFEARISDVGFWTHPSVPFNSMAIVATEKGVVALNIEDGKEVARIDGFKAGEIDVIYEEIYGVIDPEGYKSRGIAVIRDLDAGKIRFFDIHNATREFSEIGDGFSPATQPNDIETFCAGPQFGGPTRLVVFARGKMATYDVRIDKDQLTVEPTALQDQQSRDRPAPTRGCVIQKRDGEMYALYETGEVALFNEHTRRRMEVFTPTRIQNPRGIDLALNGVASDGDDSDCCGQVGVLDATEAAIRLYDIDDGKAIGSIRLKSTFDVEGVAVATAFALGQGNFGGVYRDGIIALGTNGETPVVRLAPLNGALEAIGVKFGEAQNPRIMSPNPIEYQCAEAEKGGTAYEACAPYREGAAAAEPLIPEFAPPPTASPAEPE